MRFLPCAVHNYYEEVMHMKKRKMKRAAFFEFPPEIIAGGMSLCLYENLGCSIENYGGVLTYSENILRIETARGVLRIEGDRFNIEDMDDDTLMLSGCVYSVGFERE